MTDETIFSGTPSQACNFPTFLQGGAVAVTIGGIHLVASNFFPIEWNLLFAQVGMVLIGVGLPFLKTAFTRIVIDTGRITWSQGIMRRRVSTLELSRIQGVTLFYPWWQRLAGTGSIKLITDDIDHPVRYLPAIRNVDQLSQTLNEAVAKRREWTIATCTNDLSPSPRSRARSF